MNGIIGSFGTVNFPFISSIFDPSCDIHNLYIANISIDTKQFGL